MSEENGGSSKRRRVEDRSSSLVGAGASSLSAVASTSSAHSRLKKNAAMKPVAFRKLLVEAENSRANLFIDAREAHIFDKRKINSVHCVNAPVLQSGSGGSASGSGIVKFESRREVITILENSCPELLRHLRRPGDYTHVVVFDDRSYAANCSKSVQLIHDALIKWNEGTRTSIFVLDGGFTRFSQLFPKLIVTSNDTRPAQIHPNRTPSMDEILDQLQGEDSVRVELITINKFLISLEHLDEMIAALRKLITLKAKVVTLETLEQVLNAELKDEEDKLRQALEASTPDSGRCPICYEVFRGEILQCLNGHSICSNCCERLTNCPKCRVPYEVKVRNRALEELLENEVKAECICGVRYGSKEVENHARTCVKRNNTDMDLTRIQSDLDTTKLEFGRMLGEPERISKNLADHESEGLWFSQQLNEYQKVISSVVKDLWDYRSAKKSLISSLEQTLFSMSFSNP